MKRLRHRGRALGTMTWIELKLFVREPVSLVFTMALPIVVLYVLGGVFGSRVHADEFRGVAPMRFYTPAYVALMIAALGLISLPLHLTSYRERGVLRRFRASSLPLSTVLGAQAAVTALVALVGGTVLTLLAMLSYHIPSPRAIPALILSFAVCTASFTAIGVFLAAFMPTARAAQGAGVMLWFVMLIVSGAGPPPDQLTGVMRLVGSLLPLKHVIIALQDPWLGFGINVPELLLVAGSATAAAAVALRRYQRS
jgi:ABC-2 type transport system permease protein